MNILGFRKNLTVDQTSVKPEVAAAQKKKIIRTQKTKTPEAEAFGARLRGLREERGFTGVFVAQKLGANQTTYSQYERGGGVFPAIYVLPLCKLYMITPDELFGVFDVKEHEEEQNRTEQNRTEQNTARIGAIETLLMGLLDEVRRMQDE